MLVDILMSKFILKVYYCIRVFILTYNDLTGSDSVLMNMMTKTIVMIFYLGTDTCLVASRVG